MTIAVLAMLMMEMRRNEIIVVAVVWNALVSALISVPMRFRMPFASVLRARCRVLVRCGQRMLVDVIGVLAV